MQYTHTTSRYGLLSVSVKVSPSGQISLMHIPEKLTPDSTIGNVASICFESFFEYLINGSSLTAFVHFVKQTQFQRG